MKMSKKHKLEGEFKKEEKAPKRKRRNIFADYATGKADPTQVKPLVPTETSPKKISDIQTTEGQEPKGPTVPTDGIEMASRFSKVANGILDSQGSLDPFEFTMYLRLFRLSWGYQRNYCRVSLDCLKTECRMSRDRAWKTMRSLYEKGLIIKYEEHRKLSNLYVVRLPGVCEADIRRTDIRETDIRTADKSHPSDGQQISARRTHKRLLKENSKDTTPLTPQKGEPQLKIETSRWRKDAPWWEPWDEISVKLRETLPEEDFRPLSRVLGAVRGLGRSIHIRADGLTPEVLSESLKKALAEALIEQGITVLRIAV